MKNAVVLFIIAAFAGGAFAADKSANADRIRPYGKNPHYWQYKGQPVLLLGGSKDDNLFQIPDLKEHLDLLAKVGGNCIRNTMSSRQDHGYEAYRFEKRPDGKYDLDKWNEEYWTRFENMLKLTAERDIIVQIEVWDRFDYSQQHWAVCPWRPGANVTYTNAETGLAEKYPDHPARDRQPFFHTIPGMKGYNKKLDLVRKYQERYIAKMLSHSLKYGNVLYCMNSETSTAVEWGLHWMALIEKQAREAGVDVFVTDMFDDGWKPQTSAKIRQAFDKPKRYTFMDVSQVNSRTFNQDHWVNVSWLTAQARQHPRPLNCTKIYSDGELSFGTGTPVDGVERFWRNLIAGTASCRYHRPTAGIGLNEISQACIRAARKVESRIKLWEVVHRLDLLQDRAEDEAYLAAAPGEKYLLYFTDGGAVGLDLRQAPGAFSLRWVNVSTGEWGAESTLKGGAVVTVKAPGKRGWVAVIVKAS